MFRKVLTAVAVLSLAIVAGAGAKTVTVTITKSGYVPSSVTVAQNDVVQFTNSDSTVHQIVFKTTAGVTCTPSPLVIQPGTSGSCAFRTAGSYTYSDPSAKGNAFRGSISVTAATPALSIAGKPTLFVYGASSVVSGTSSAPKAGSSIDVLAQQCGASASTKLVTVLANADGVYTTTVKPLMNTAYSAKDKAVASSTLNVRVRPSLRLTKVAAHRYTLRVAAGSSLAGKYASFQRYNAATLRWVPLRTVLLKASTVGVAPTVVARAAFRSSLRSGLRIRATLPQVQVGRCYAAGTSNTIKS